jgi:hypothetical protein
MRRAILKTVFVITVLFFLVIFLSLSPLLTDTLFPVAPGPDGLYHSMGGGPLLVGIVAFGCIWIADRGTSHLFRLTRLTDERWSIFKSRRRC